MGKKNNHAGNKVARSPAPHSFLGRELRVELTDGRAIVGTLIAYEGSGDLLLRSAIEQCVLKDGKVTVHRLHAVAIPFKHVKKLHRRVLGQEPLVAPTA